MAGYKLKALNSHWQRFLKELKDVETVLEIYSSDTHVHLTGAARIKGNYWHTVDFAEIVVPGPVEVNGRRTFKIMFPTAWPKEIGGQIPYPMMDDDALRKEGLLVRCEVIEKFQNKEVDLRNSDDLAHALAGGQLCIERIDEAKQKLATLIRDNFPLNQLLM